MYWYRIMYKAKINMALAEQQGLSKNEIDNIIVLQQKRSDIRNGIVNKVIMPTRQVGEELPEFEYLSIWKRSQQSLQKKSWLENIEKQFNEQMKLRKAA